MDVIIVIHLSQMIGSMDFHATSAKMITPWVISPNLNLTLINGQSNIITISVANKYVFHKWELLIAQAVVHNAQWIYHSPNVLPVILQNITV